MRNDNDWPHTYEHCTHHCQHGAFPPPRQRVVSVLAFALMGFVRGWF